VVFGINARFPSSIACRVACPSVPSHPQSLWTRVYGCKERSFPCTPAPHQFPSQAPCGLQSRPLHHRPRLPPPYGVQAQQHSDKAREEAGEGRGQEEEDAP